jgi:hypothetical protein
VEVDRKQKAETEVDQTPLPSTPGGGLSDGQLRKSCSQSPSGPGYATNSSQPTDQTTANMSILGCWVG